MVFDGLLVASPRFTSSVGSGGCDRADDLLLTRESEDQMADLAGNAMTSTVVGACILSALLVGQDSLLALKQPKSGKAGKPQPDG